MAEREVLNSLWAVVVASSWGDWLRDVLASFFPWPLLGAAAIAYILFSEGATKRLEDLLGLFKSIKVGGAEFILNEQEAKRVANDLGESFSTYRAQFNREYDRLVEVHGLRQRLDNTLGSSQVAAVLKDVPGYRCTIHVPDSLFAERMYQLLDYYPSGAGRGRTWSIRFGILGLAWRLGQTQVRGNVPTNIDELVKDWGMTREQATAAGQGKQSFACIVLRDQAAVGILYIDSDVPNAFKVDPEQLDAVLTKACQESGITAALTTLNRDLRGRGPSIRVDA